jgi:hypothetical protein
LIDVALVELANSIINADLERESFIAELPVDMRCSCASALSSSRSSCGRIDRLD